jgi:regulation of enolase protein 1 (concanavalin A-like superfamily)
MTNQLSPSHAVQKSHWRKALSLPLVLALLLGSFLALQAAPAAADGWVIECVDCPRQFSNMTDRSLRLDAEGHPHVAYGEEHLYHAWHDGANWHYEVVDDSPYVGQHASLTLDAGGYPHISYYDYHLKYAYQDASGWHLETVDSEWDVGNYTSLALDGNGYPHISYYDEWNEDLKYAYQDASGWHIETVDSERDVGEDSSLALDGDGYPHISYYGCYDNGKLKYAYQNASGWHIEIVDSEGGSHTSLALDGDGYPHISYFKPFCCPGPCAPRDLKYAYQDASGWHIETVDSEGGGSTSLALDGDGYPHISYYDTSNEDLKYAYQDASGWRIETVDSEGNVGEDSSLALGGNGYPHISYYDETNYGLKYAYQDAAGWYIETVDSEGSVGAGTSLALDEGGYPHISYYDSTNDDLKYAYQDALGWHSETVGGGGYCSISLALDGNGYPHISYRGGGLKYAYQDASGWHIEMVDSEWYVGTYTSLALDGNGYPHISYYAGSVLRYVYQDGSGWHIETVDSERGEVGSFTSLALDGEGYPHISYFYCGVGGPSGCNVNDLRYAYQDASGWHIQTVDSEGKVGTYTSLALDAGGYPHISYRGGGLKYAYQDASGWHVQTVDSEGGGSTSLALDAGGYPHISYHGSGLEYAYQDASGWHIEMVDSEGSSTSLALDGDGYPHISYHDTTNRDLKYAYYPGFSMQNQDVGNVGVPGSFSEFTGVFTVEGSGGDIYGSADAFHYAYLMLDEDGEIVARVISVENTHPWAKAGVMIRETLNADSKNALIALTPGNGVTFQHRSSTGGSTNWNKTSALSVPYWVKLVRSGDMFTAYRSDNGVSWAEQGFATISMANSVYIGLAVTSHNDGVLCTAQFDHLSVSGTRPILSIPDNIPARVGQTVSVPINFTSNGHSIASTTFSVDFDQTYLAFDPTDSDQDGIPDTVAFNVPAAFDASVTFDEGDTDGELAFFIADLFPPLAMLSDGAIVSVTLNVGSPPSTTEVAVNFSPDPAASFGDTSGQSVPGTTDDGSVLIGSTDTYKVYLPLLWKSQW